MDRKHLLTVIDSAAWWAIDQAFNSTPGVNIIWWAIKNTVASTPTYKIMRALEFWEWMADNWFLESLAWSEQAIDGITICFEAYVKQRTEKKRKLIKNFFLWFTELSEGEKENFELEAILDIINKIPFKEIETLKKVSNFLGWEVFSSKLLTDNRDLQLELNESLSVLVSLWLFSLVTWVWYDSSEDQGYKVTYLWRKIIKYILDDEE